MISIRSVQERLARVLTLLAILVLSVPPAKAAGPETIDSLDQQFQTPPASAYPWVYWVWLNAGTTPATITRDLAAMKATGITGCILYDCGPGNWTWPRKVVLSGKEYRVVTTPEYTGGYMTPVPGEPIPAWSPRWRQLVAFAAGEAARLGVDFVVANGLANTSGPITDEYGEQKLVWTQKLVHGPATFDGQLPKPRATPPRRNTFPELAATSYLRDVAVLAIPNQAGFSSDQVVNLTSKTDAAGHITWQVPPGDWEILRYAQTATGARNSFGLFNDSLSDEAMDKTWAVTMAPLLKEMTPDQRRGLKGIEDDSWESGKTLWTKKFPEEFQQRRGYDLIPFLPMLLANSTMGDAATRARVLRDYQLTISDLIAEHHYAHLNQLANENGLTFYSEAAGPNYDQADVLKTSSRVDMAMAEFWMPSDHRPYMPSRFILRNAANANHIYGKPVTMCEAFTSLGPEWEETPLSMKPVADQAFCDGLNKLCIHNFSQSPSLTAKPGYVYCAGTHYEPGITWWDQTPAFNTYLARCSQMLQAGHFVADALFFHGDNIGKGEWLKTIPPALGEGYDHDNCNTEVLLTRMSVRDGRLVLPDGMSYRVLVLPDGQPMTMAALEKISTLLNAGATIVGPRPTSLAGMPANDGEAQKFNDLAAQLWSGLDGSRVTHKSVGTGQLFWGVTVRQVLQTVGTPPDFEQTGLSDAGTIDWIHRTTDDAEIYFVASRWEYPEKIAATFRVNGRQPELWDPVTGERRDATAFHEHDGHTTIPLEFNPWGSVFVVFRKPIAPELSGPAASNYPATPVLTTLSGAWTVHFDPKWGGPDSVQFDTLTDWTNRPEPGIKYYSGAAVYHQNFALPAPPAPGQRLLLDLGEVHDVATVRLNGKDLGVVWTKPARVDITDAVRAADNDLEVNVVNLWPNRLKYDETLPKEQRLTESNVHKFGEATPLLPSGLIGPVTILAPVP